MLQHCTWESNFQNETKFWNQTDSLVRVYNWLDRESLSFFVPVLKPHNTFATLLGLTHELNWLYKVDLQIRGDKVIQDEQWQSKVISIWNPIKIHNAGHTWHQSWHSPGFSARIDTFANALSFMYAPWVILKLSKLMKFLLSFDEESLNPKSKPVKSNHKWSLCESQG